MAQEPSYEQTLEFNLAKWLWHPKEIKWVHPLLPLIPSVAHFVCFQECRAFASLAMLDSLALAAVVQERKKGQPV